MLVNDEIFFLKIVVKRVLTAVDHSVVALARLDFDFVVLVRVVRRVVLQKVFLL